MLTDFFWEIADNVDKKNPSLYNTDSKELQYIDKESSYAKMMECGLS